MQSTTHSDFVELARVRVASYAGAVALAALALGLLVQRLPNRFDDQDAIGAAALSVTIEQAPTPTSRPAPQKVRHIPSTGAAQRTIAAYVTGDSGGESHTWLHGSARNVHFATERDYLRCLEAAIAHRSIDGCPPPPTGQSLTEPPPRTINVLDPRPRRPH